MNPGHALTKSNNLFIYILKDEKYVKHGKRGTKTQLSKQWYK